MLPHRPRRLGRILHYAFLTAAGGLATFEPSLVLKQTVASYVTYAWVVFIFVGAGLSLFGTIRNEWLGEYIGAPLLVFAIGGIGIISILAFFTSGFPPAAAVVGLFYLGLSFGILARWREVNEQRKTARKFKFLKPGEPR